MLMALSFVPPADVAAVFDEFVQQCPPEMADVIDYWEDNYIGRMRLNTRVNPRLPIPLWNVRYMVVLQTAFLAPTTLLKVGTMLSNNVWIATIHPL